MDFVRIFNHPVDDLSVDVGELLIHYHNWGDELITASNTTHGNNTVSRKRQTSPPILHHLKIAPSMLLRKTPIRRMCHPFINSLCGRSDEFVADLWSSFASPHPLSLTVYSTHITMCKEEGHLFWTTTHSCCPFLEYCIWHRSHSRYALRFYAYHTAMLSFPFTRQMLLPVSLNCSPLHSKHFIWYNAPTFVQSPTFPYGRCHTLFCPTLFLIRSVANQLLSVTFQTLYLIHYSHSPMLSLVMSNRNTRLSRSALNRHCSMGTLNLSGTHDRGGESLYSCRKWSRSPVDSLHLATALSNQCCKPATGWWVCVQEYILEGLLALFLYNYHAFGLCLCVERKSHSESRFLLQTSMYCDCDQNFEAFVHPRLRRSCDAAVIYISAAPRQHSS